MSFGFSVCDFLAAARVAKSIYESCRKGPAEYKELCSETQSLKYALESLSDDAREPSSILNRKGIQRKGELDEIISSCKSTMMDLQIIIDRHSSLRPDHRGNITRIWDAYRVASIDLDSYRGKLTFHTSTIGVFLLSLQGPAMGRIETKLDKIYARMIRDDIAQARQSTASFASTVSILSQIDTNEDDVFAILKAELLTEDISMARILAHKDDIVTHMKKLVSNGSAGDAETEEQRRAVYQQTWVPSSSIDSFTLESSLLELHKELEASRRAHQEVKAQLETRELQADRTYDEKLALLEKRYQYELMYVKGTGKIPQRMREELKKRKAENQRLLSELEESNRALWDTESANSFRAHRSLIAMRLLPAKQGASPTRVETQMTRRLGLEPRS